MALQKDVLFHAIYKTKVKTIMQTGIKYAYMWLFVKAVLCSKDK